jgi:trans-aconitate methyltransferase
MGVVGGAYAVRLLTALSPDGRSGLAEGVPEVYQNASKLQVLLGPEVWQHTRGKVVVDFGCGEGHEAVELAQRGAAHVVGIDIREKWLEHARVVANARAIAHRCTFVQQWTGGATADVIVSLDSFEHFEDPAEILRMMDSMLAPTGRVLAAFGPTWYHPYGGHLFSVFPWAHLLFSEAAMSKWRSSLPGKKPMTSFRQAGLNKMSVRRFEKLVAASPLRFDAFEAVPIRRLRWAAGYPLREFTTSIVRCQLVKRRAP